MKISIVTACFNSASTIQDTIQSIQTQTYQNIEHIVVDGASKDLTMTIVKSSPSVTKYLSEPDQGIYDAMNKGLLLATGDVIGTLNSDDFYFDDSVIASIAKVFEDESVEACYADLVYVSQENTDKVIRYWKSKPYQPALFKKGWMPAHPTFFARKNVYEKYGLFDLNYRIAADFELLFRLVEQHKVRTVYLPKVLVKMRLGGTTNKNLHNILKQNKEIIKVLSSQYSDFSTTKFWTLKILNRLKQFIASPA